MDTQSFVKLEHQDGQDVLYILGAITEDIEIHLNQILPQMGNKVVINFAKVSSINSLGVRAWIHFMRGLEGKEVFFESCTPVVVSQMNMIPSFFGKAKVMSVWGMFECNDCGNEISVLYEKGKNFPDLDSDELDCPPCTKCGSENTEFEELEDTYFAFAEAS